MSAPPPVVVATTTPVVMTFEYTFEEIHEGLTQSPETRRSMKVSSIGAVIVVAGLVLALIGLVLLLVYANATAPAVVVAGTRASRNTVEARAALTPSCVAAAAVLTFFLVAVGAAWSVRARTPACMRLIRIVVAAATLALLIAIWYAVSAFRAEPPPDAWQIDRALALVLSLVPWVAIIAAIIGYLRWLTRTQIRRDWSGGKPYLRRRRTITLDATGERMTDDKTEMLYRWPVFRRAWETDRLLVLQDENDLRHILPKRALDRTTLDLARAVISNHVADCKFLTMPGGFPVSVAAGRVAAR